MTLVDPLERLLRPAAAVELEEVEVEAMVGTATVGAARRVAAAVLEEEGSSAGEVVLSATRSRACRA